ncbi:MAG TPA: hypothetical protein VGI61_08755 [Parafilimonas sp.]
MEYQNFFHHTKKRASVKLEDIEISFLGFKDLIKNKQFNARPKDLIDLEQLRKIKNNNQQQS